MVDKQWVDGQRMFEALILAKLLTDFSLCLERVAEDLAPDPMEGLQEVLGVEFLGCQEQCVDISRDDVEESVHSILVV